MKSILSLLAGCIITASTLSATPQANTCECTNCNCKKECGCGCSSQKGCTCKPSQPVESQYPEKAFEDNKQLQ